MRVGFSARVWSPLGLVHIRYLELIGVGEGWVGGGWVEGLNDFSSIFFFFLILFSSHMCRNFFIEKRFQGGKE